MTGQYGGTKPSSLASYGPLRRAVRALELLAEGVGSQSSVQSCLPHSPTGVVPKLSSVNLLFAVPASESVY